MPGLWKRNQDAAAEESVKPMKMKWIEVEDTSTGHMKRNAAIGAVCAAGLAGAAAIVAKRRHSQGDETEYPSSQPTTGGTHQMPEGVRSPFND